MAPCATTDSAWAEPADDAAEGSTQIVLVVQGATPSDPDNPSGPDNPDNPDKPNNPDNPDKPGNQDDPDNPLGPNNPSNPDDPDKPGNQDNPDVPSGPDTPNPANPTNPGAPANTDNPVKPADPSNPADYDGNGTIDKEDLAGVIADAEKVSQGDKSDASYKDLLDAINAARAVLENPNASDSDIAAAVEALEKAADAFYKTADGQQQNQNQQQQDQQESTQDKSGSSASAKTSDSIVWLPIVLVALVAAAVAVYARRRAKGKGFTKFGGLFSAIVVVVLASTAGAAHFTPSAIAQDGKSDGRDTYLQSVVHSVLAQAKEAQDAIKAPEVVKIVLTKGDDGLLEGSDSLVFENNNAYYMRMSKVHVDPIGEFIMGSSDDTVKMSITPRAAGSAPIDAAATTITGGIDPSSPNLPLTSPWLNPGRKASADNELVLKLDVQTLNDLEPGEYPVATLDWGFEPVVYQDLDVSMSSSPVVGRALTAVVKNAPQDDVNNLTFAWCVSEDGGETWAKIEGADSATHTPTAEEANKLLRVEVSCENDAWYDVKSAMFVSVADVFKPVETEDVFTVEYMLGEHGANPPAAESVAKGAKVTRPEDPTDPDWSFDGWFVDEGLTTPWRFESDTVTEDMTLYAKWTRAEDDQVPYKVNHYLQVIDENDLPQGAVERGGKYYVLDNAQTFYGKAGDSTSEARNASYAGFVHEAFEKTTIGSDGNTVVDIYYNRVNHTVTFSTGDMGVEVPSQTVRHGALVTRPQPDPAYDGWVFTGWYADESFQEPFSFANNEILADTTLYAKWTRAEDDQVPYKVNHYLQVIDENDLPQGAVEHGGKHYVLDNAQTFYGKADEPADEAEPAAYDGFTAQDVLPTTIAADGSTVISIFYDRVFYTVRFQTSRGQAPADVTVPYGNKVARPNDNPEAEGWLFEGWFISLEGNEPAVFPFGPTEDITLQAKWVPATDTAYAVNHYLQVADEGNLPEGAVEHDGKHYVLDQHDSLHGTTEEPAKVTENTYEGFSAQEFQNEPIAADGSTVISIYYDRHVANITLDPNGGFGSAIVLDPKMYDASAGGRALPPDPFTRDGYEFTGWNTSPNGEGGTYVKPDVTVKDVTLALQGNVTLYAQWEIVKHTVTFNMNDHGDAVGAQRVERGSLANRPADPADVVDGATTWHFNGWYKDADFKQAFNFATDRVTEDITLYAKWTALNTPIDPSQDPSDVVDGRYTVNHWTEPLPGVEAPANTQTKKHDGITYWLEESELVQGEPNQLTNAQPKSYEGFANLPYDQATISSDEPTVIDIFYSRSANVPYTVKHLFQAAEGTGYLEDESLREVKTGTAGEDTDAQALSLDGFTVLPIDQQPISGDGTTVVEVRYDRVTHTVTFSTAYGTVEDQTVRHGALATRPADPVAEEADRYVFNGWYKDLQFTQPFSFANELVTADLELHAQWIEAVPSEVPYAVRHWLQVLNPADLNADSLPDGYTKDGSTIYCIDDEQTFYGEAGATAAGAVAATYDGFTAKPFTQPNVSANLVVDIFYDRDTYEVSFEANGHGTAPQAQRVTFGDLATRPDSPEAAGWQFEGWFTDADCTNPQPFPFAPASDMRLYAKWAPRTDVEYAVEYYLQNTELNGFDKQDADTETLTGTAGELTEAPERAYTGFTALAIENRVIDGAGTTVVEVRYTRHVVNISFSPNGADSGSVEALTGVVYADGATQPTIPANGFARDGYAFTGWNTEPDGSGRAYAPDTAAAQLAASFDGDVTLYAQWEIVKHTVTFNMNSHGDAVNEQKVEHGSLAERPANPADADSETNNKVWHFNGWYKDAQLTQAFNFENEPIVADTEVFAKWTELPQADENTRDGRFTVRHWVEVLSGDTAPANKETTTYQDKTFYLEETEVLMGELGHQTNAQPKYYVGFENLEYGQTSIGNDKDAVVNIYYVRAIDTRYTVKHLLQGETGSGYVEDASLRQTLTGETGAQTEATARDIEGFRALEIAQQIIAGNGQTIVEVKYDRILRTISFDTGASPDAVESQLVRNGARATRPADPSYAGHAFGGWYRNAELTQAWSFDVDAVYANHVLYAKWVDETDMHDDPTASPENEAAYTVNHYLPLSANESHAGAVLHEGVYYRLDRIDNRYGVIGQQTQATALNFDGLEAGVNQQTVKADSSTVVDIYYNRAEVRVTFNANGHGTAPAAKTVAYGETVTRPADPTAEGFEFSGWYAEAECHQMQSFPFNAATDITLYAKWMPKTYTVTFGMQDHGVQIAPRVGVVHGDLITRPADPVDSTGAYVFNGWSWDVSDNGADPTRMAFSFTTDRITSDTTLYANWTEVQTSTDPEHPIASYKVHHLQRKLNQNDYDLVETETLFGEVGQTTAAQSKNYAGFTPLGFEQATIDANGTTVVEIKYGRTSDIRYTVRHLLQNADGNGFTDASDSPEYRAGTTGAATQATAHHYAHFISPTTLEVVQAQRPIAADQSTVVTLYYYRMTHQVMFDLNDASGAKATGQPDDQTVRYGDKATRPADPEREGYTFDGWYTDADCTQAFSIATEPVDSDLVLYAKWVEIPADPQAAAYAVQHYLQPLSGDDYLLADETTEYGTVGQTANPTVRSYTGFEQNTAKTEAPVVAESGTVAKVYYDRKNVTIAYDMNGHGTQVPTQNVKYGTPVLQPAVQTIDEFFFRGWFIDHALTNQQVFPFDAVANVTLRAKWTGNPDTPYTVQHMLQDSGLGDSYTTVETENKVGTAGEPSEAHVKSFPGFTAQAITQTPIAKDMVVEVKYDRHVVNVRYDANGGSGEMTGHQVAYDDTSTNTVLSPNTFTRDGYMFTGWNVNPDGSGKALSPTATARDVATDLNGDVTLYAQWQETGFTVAFNLNGHGAGTAPDAQTVAAGALAQRPDDPTDVDYDFAGWYKESACETAFSFATDAINASTTLYAKWNQKYVDAEGAVIPQEDAIAYRVEHYQQKLNGAGYDLVESETQYGRNGEQTHATAKDYAGFVAQQVTQQTLSSTNPEQTVVKVYYDRGAAVSYKVKHLKQNAAGTAYVEDESATQTLSGVAGATTMAEPRDYGDSYEAQPFDQKTIAADGSTVVEIRYKCMAYEVQFEMNGHGNQIDAQRVLHGGYAERPAEPIAQGYVFNGWFKDREFTQAFSFGAEPVTSEVMLYAKWTQDLTDPDSPNANNYAAYKVNHYLQVLDETNPPQGAVAHDGKHYALDNVQTLYGEKNANTNAQAVQYAGFISPVPTQATIAENGTTVIDLFYDRGNYTVSFNANGHGTAPESISGPYGTIVNQPADLAEQGYTFAGWFTDSTLATPQPFPFPMETTTTLYAKWTPADDTKYTVDHRIQTLDLQTYDSQTEQLEGATGEETDAQARELEGFDVQPFSQKPIEADGTTTVEITYDRHSVNVSFDANGGTGQMEDKTLTYNEIATLPLCTFTRTGYEFAGWNTQADGNGEAFGITAAANAITADHTGNLVLYAQWQPETYTVTFNMHGFGTQVAPQAGIAYGTAASRPSDPVADGYTFDGWYADAGYERAFSFATDLITGNTELHAKWAQAEDGQADDPNEQKVSYQVNHLQQTLDQTGYVLAETTTGFGYPNNMTDAQAKPYAGFTAQAIVQQQIADDGSTIVEIRYDRDADTTYTVKHLLQNATGMGYTEDASNRQTLSGVAGAQTAAAALTYSGFTAQEIAQKTIAGNGTTVIEVRYDREVCTVTFSLQGKGEDFTREGRVGAYVSRPAAPAQYNDIVNDEKYSFEGWYADEDYTQAWDFGTRALTGDTTIYAHWVEIPPEPVWYTVDFYQETFAAPGEYTLVDSVDVPGAKNTKAQAIARAYDGFTLVKIDDTAYASSDNLVTNKDLVEGGEKVAIAMYYKRNTYQVTLDYNGHGYGEGQENQTNEYRFAHMLDLPTPSEAGYTFGGWRVQTTGAAQASPMMVTQDVTLVAQWQPNSNTPYTVRHLKQDLADSEKYETAWVEVRYGTTGSATAAQARQYDGFQAQSITQGTIAADGKTSVDVKYDRKTYGVKLAYQGHGGTDTTLSAAYEGTVTAPVMPAIGDMVDGFRFGGWFSTSQCAAGTEFDFTAPVTADVTAYAKWTEITHQVTYDFGDLGSNLVVTVRHGDTLTQPQNTVVGYDLEGWYVNDDGDETRWNFESDKVTTDNLVLKAKFTPKNDTEYTVIHAWQAAEGSPYNYVAVDADTEHKTGVTGGTTAAEAKEYDGFTAQAFEQKAIAADGSTVVRINYQRKTADVTFDLNLPDLSGAPKPEGLEAPEKQEAVRFGAHIAEPETLPDVPRWAFSGWYASDSGTTWNFATDMMPAENLVLHAKWVPATYTVTFVTFVNATVDSIPNINYGQTITQPDNPEADNLTFVGWYTDTSFTDDSAWNFTADQVTSNMTLYAKWTPNLVFNMGGVVDDIVIPCVMGAEVPKPVLSTVAGYSDIKGYSFVEWYKDAAFTAAQDFPVTVNQDTTVYAKWRAHRYTVKFDSNGGANRMPDMNMTYDEARNLLQNNFRKQGYEFAGWNTEADGSGTAYGDCATVLNLADEDGAVVTLYAMWDPSPNTSYTARHLYQSLANPQVYEQVEGSIENLTGTTGQSADVTPRTTPGFTLASMESKVIEPDGTTVVNLKYDRQSYNVMFDTNGHGPATAPTAQTVSFGALIADPQATDPQLEMTEPGYQFQGWCIDPEEGTAWNFAADTMPAENLVLKAKWDPEHYDITLNMGGHGRNTVLDRAYLESVARPDDPVATGYTFDGWFSDEEMTTPQEFPMAVTGPATIYAKWTPNQYDIVYNLNGGVGTAPETAHTHYGAAAIALPDDSAADSDEPAFERAGYTFAGWNTRADGSGLMYAPGTQVRNLTRSNGVAVTLYAKWNPRTDTRYEVHHLLQNLDGTYEDVEADVQRLEGTTGANTGAVAKAYTGFTAQEIAQLPIAGDGTTVVEVHYDRTPYTVTYNLNGKGDALTETVVFGAEVPNVAATAPGFELVGWYKEKACLNAWDFGTPANPDDSESVAQPGESMPAHDLTLYANWRVGTYTITLNMGSLLDDIVSEQQGGTKYKRPANPTVTGYKFLGWFEDAVFSVAQTWPFTVAEDKDIFAKWEAKTYELRFSKNHEKTATGSMNYVTVNYGDDFVMPDCGWTIPGYEFQSWNTSAEGTGDTYKAGQTYNSITTGTYVRFYAQWAPSSDTPYKVEHYLQRASGVGYDRADADDEWLRGTTGALAEATFNEYDGYEPRDASVPEVQIKANGTSVVKLYYVRKAYDVTFDVNGMTTTTDPNPAKREGIIFGNKVAKPTAPTAQGYTFDGWYADAACTTEWNFAADTVSDNTTLYAKWVPQQVGYKVEHYKQKLDSNGQPADYELASIEEKAGLAGELTDAQPLTDEGFTARDYDLAAIAGDGGTVVKIYYDRKAHSVAFNANGHGTAPEGYDTVYYGAKVAAPATPPEEPGYTLEGWCTDAACTQDWSFDSSTMPDADLTLHAKWSQNQYTIKYDMAGKLSDVEDRGHVYGELVTQPVAPTGAIGYTFDRWYTSADHLTVQHYPIQVTGNKTVYAGWKPNTYSIEFDANGGIGTMSGITATYDQNTTLPESLFQREGMAFAGWGTTRSGGAVYGSVDDNGAATVPNLASDQDAVVKLYAQWKGNEYDIVLHANNGTADSTIVHAVYGTETAPLQNSFTNTGYVFAGWAAEPNGTGATYENGERVLNLAFLNGDVVNLYAQWTPDPNTPYKVDHYQANVDGTDFVLFETTAATGMSGTQTAAVAKDYEGFTPQPVTQTTIAGDGSTHVSVYYDRNLYVVMFMNNLDGGFTPEGYLAPYGATLDTPYQREVGGYTFTGWYSDPDKTQKWTFGDGGTTMPANDVTLYTKWEEATYSLTFNMGEHAAESRNPLTGLHYGEVVQASRVSDPTPEEGYAFDGWFADEDFYEQKSFPLQIEGDTTLYARWRGARYNVSFDNNEAYVKQKYADQLAALGDTYKADVTGEMNNVTMEYGTSVELPENNYNLPGFEFKGWNTKADGTGTSYADKQEVQNLASADDATIKLYAQWEAPETAEYTVMYVRQKADDVTDNPADMANYDLIEGPLKTAGNSSGNPSTTIENSLVQVGKTFDKPTYGTKASSNIQMLDDSHRSIKIKNTDGVEEEYEAFKAPEANLKPIAPDGSTVIYVKYDREMTKVRFEYSKSDGTKQGLSWTDSVEVRCGSHLRLPETAGIDTGSNASFTSDGKWYMHTGSNHAPETGRIEFDIDVDTVPYSPDRYVVYFDTDWSVPSYTVTLISEPESDGTIQSISHKWQRGTTVVGTSHNTSNARMNYLRNDWYASEEGTEERSGSDRGPNAFKVPVGYAEGTGDSAVKFFTDAACTQPLENHSLLSDETVYLKWVPNEYSLNFVKQTASDGANSNSNGASTITANYDAIVTIPSFTGAVPDGKRFASWNTRWDGKGTTFYAGQEVSVSEVRRAYSADQGGDESSLSKTTPLYSIWSNSSDTPYAVKHMMQPKTGGTSSVSSFEEGAVDSLFGETDALTQAKIRTFEGFHLSTVKTFNEETDQATIKGDGSTVVSIYYDRDTFNVTYDVGGVTDAKNVPSAKTGVRYDVKLSELTAPTSANYLFDGWFKDKECTRAWDFDNDTVKSNITLYAKWTPCYTVTFNMQGHGSQIAAKTKVRTGTAITAPANPAATDCVFGGWYKDADCTHPWHFDTDTVTESTTLYAKWSAQYKVTFNKNGVTANVEMPATQTGLMEGSKVAKPAALSAAGYEYVGWYKEPACENAWNFASDTISGSTTLYLKMTPKSYGIVYDLNGGKWDEKKESHPEIETVAFDQEITISNPVRDGYEFTGWTVYNMDSANHTVGGTATTTSTAIDVMGTKFKSLRYDSARQVQMRANWTPIKYTVKYNANINYYSGSMDSEVFKYGYRYTLTSNQFTRANYKFLGWSRSSNATVPDFEDRATVSNLTTVKGSTVNLYGVWERIGYDISYDLDGGTFGSYHPNTMYMGSSYNVSYPTKTGYSFAGWNITGMTNSEHYMNSPGTTYATSLSGVMATTFQNLRDRVGTVYFKATWSPIHYRVTLNANGGNFYDSYGSKSSIGTTWNEWDNVYRRAGGNDFVYDREYNWGSSWLTYYYTGASYLHSQGVERAGYKFLGWSTNRNATTGFRTFSNLTTSSGATVTLYAIWEKE